MLPTEDLFVYVYILVDDAISARAVAIAPRPGPVPRRRARRMVLRLPPGGQNRPGQPGGAGLGIVPAAVNERGVAEDLLDAGPPPRDLLADKGFAGAAFAAAQAARGTAVLLPPAKGRRRAMPPILRKIIAQWRKRVETTFGEITDQMGLTRHGAHTFWGLLTRTAATIAAHTLMRLCLTGT